MKKLFLTVLFLGSLIFSSNVYSATATAVYQQGVNGYAGGVDNEISSDNPTTVYSNGGSHTTDRMGVRFCSTKCNNILLRFDNLNIPSTATILKVELQLNETSQQGGSNYLYASKINKTDWNSTAVTWNAYKSGTNWSTSGGDYGSAIATASAPGSGWVTFNLGTSLTVNDIQQNGIMISTDIPGWNYVWFNSNEATDSSLRPKLLVTYSDASVPDDTTAPTVSAGSPSSALSSGTTSTGLSVNTNESSYCRYSTSPNVAYTQMTNQFTVDGGTTHSSTISGLTSGTSYNYYIKCQDLSGNANTADYVVSFSVSAVVVTPPPSTSSPTVTISASPTSVTSGSSSTLTWSSTNATSCTASGSWTGAKAVSGTQSVTPTTNGTYTLSCTGAGGTASQSVTVFVGSVVSVPTGGGLKVDLSYVNQTSPEFTRFKSVVDAALAGSPDYGFEPQHAAYMYKITGDAKYCDYAITFAESCPNSYDLRYGISCGVQGAEADIAAGRSPHVAGDSYLEVGPIISSLALTYDWCGFRMTDAQKTRWSNYANQAIYNVWHPSSATWGGRSFPWTGWSIDNPGNNYYYSFLKATMYWALATKDSTLLSFTRNQKLQPMVDYFSQIPGGGSLEGTGYGTAHMGMFQLYQTWKDSTGEDLANANSHLTDSIKFWLHATTPNRAYYSPIGDLARASFPDIFDYHRRLVLEAKNLTNSPAAQDTASWWLNHISIGQMSRRIDSQWDLIPDGNNTNSAPNEPLTYQAKGVGRIFTRTGWDTGALWMTFVAGKYNESHAHQDQGSFDLANNDWLAVTNNIYTNSGIEQTTDYHNVLRFVQNGSIVPQREGTESIMTVNQIGTNGDIDVTGNITPAYAGSSAVQNWTRNIKFAGRKLTVTDNYAVTSGTQAVFQVGVPVAPVISGNTVTAGNLKIRVLTPANPTITVVNIGRYRVDIAGGTGQYVVELTDGALGTAPAPTNPAPTVTISASPTSVTSGSSSTLTWSSTNATSCTASGSWTGAKAVSGTQSVTPTTNGTYTLSCTGAGGTTAQSATVTVSTVVNPPVVSTKFTVGQRVQTTANVNVRSTASASGSLLGTQLSGSLGTVVSGPTNADSFNWWNINYDTGVDGFSAEDFVNVYVSPTNPAPTVTISASPTSVTSGSSSTLTWSSTNATSCTASGSWTGAKAVSGTQSVTPTTNGTYTLSCTGAGGTTAQSATVTVSTVVNPPVVSGVAVYKPFDPTDTSDASLIKFAETWARNWNFEGYNVSTTDWSGWWDYTETTYEPWLFDRASVGYYLYKRSGDVKWLNKFLSDFAWYRSRIDSNGFFTPTAYDDNKYAYIRPFLLYERQTGDTQYRNQALSIYNMWLGEVSNTYNTSIALWTERELGLALEVAVDYYDLTGSQAALTRANALVAQWSAMSANNAGAPLHSVTQHEGGGGSQMITSPWMSALYFQAAYKLYALTGNTEILQQISKYSDWMEQYGYFSGSALGVSAVPTAPYYLAGPTGPYAADTPNTGDFAHCLDVGNMVKFGIVAKQTLGQSTTALTNRLAQLKTCATYYMTDATRTTITLPKYRVNPPRLFNWWMRSTVEYSNSGTPTTPTNPAPTVTISASPTSVTTGGSSTLTWSSTNATSCTVTPGSYTGTSGTQTVTPTTNTTYSISCTGAGGTVTNSATVLVSTVVVTPPATTTPPTLPPATTTTAIVIGDKVQTTVKVNVRRTPAGTRLGTQIKGSTGVVTEGPIKSGSYNWYKIDYASGVDGWTRADLLKKVTVTAMSQQEIRNNIANAFLLIKQLQEQLNKLRGN